MVPCICDHQFGSLVSTCVFILVILQQGLHDWRILFSKHRSDAQPSVDCCRRHCATHLSYGAELHALGAFLPRLAAQSLLEDYVLLHWVQCRGLRQTALSFASAYPRQCQALGRIKAARSAAEDSSIYIYIYIYRYVYIYIYIPYPF